MVNLIAEKIIAENPDEYMSVWYEDILIPKIGYFHAETNYGEHSLCYLTVWVGEPDDDGLIPENVPYANGPITDECGLNPIAIRKIIAECFNKVK